MPAFMQYLSGPLPTQPVSPQASAQWRQASYYRPAPDLEQSLEMAISLGTPLLITGEPGCGKTSAAYWAAWRMGLGHQDLYHAQVRSDASAARLKYEFDAVKYFRESQAVAARHRVFDDDRRRFLIPGPLWQCFEAAQTRPVVLLLDEIDKAPRDFPNDLLHEFEVQRFEVPDWPDVDGAPHTIAAPPPTEKSGLRLIVITSNGERQLPDAFLRRCLHHHLRLTEQWVREVVKYRREHGEILPAEDLVRHAITRYLALHAQNGLRHRPGLHELLVWLRLIALAGGTDAEKLQRVRLADLPYLGALVKDPLDHQLLANQSG